VDRKALPAPSHEEKQPDLDEARPRNAVEEKLAGIWMELFKVKSIGIHDDFFDLGGHSLLGIKLMSRIREGFGVDLPVLTLFENPTIAGLADGLSTSGITVASSTEDFI
jgi:surfactin family lipopeptide synthetase C